MKENRKKQTYSLTLGAIFVALATVLSMIKLYKLPLGGSVTLLSMLPIIIAGCMLGKKWGILTAFVYSLVQLSLGIAVDGLFGWGLTPICLIGTIMLDYIIPFTLLGTVSLVAKKGTGYIIGGTAIAVALRFICHFLSGYIIFANFEKFVVFGGEFINRPALYSLCYNGSYMLPELVITLIGTVIIVNLPQVKKLMHNS